ncbi:DUF3857 domain-containing protein [Dysgonomonas sp. Marseille-P4361]|uniref:DUF3857 domain-containing protein n=1 Tax=Dysgonomonas sp. Marseille-P4361 TaxID=2161820 RepID=UPI000D55B39F|nr:DUF3857 domain-containing protein [Dysgonomonas sp. Marseille-P4361]
MRYYILFLFTLISVLLHSQSHKSEIILYKSLSKVENNKLTRIDTIVLQINDRAGDNDVRISIDYTKGDKLSIGSAWIEDLEGNIIRKLNKKDIEDRNSISDISLYEDDFVKTFELKHNVYPYRIVYSYKKTFSKFFSVFSINYAESLTPVREAIITVDVDSKKEIKYRQRNVDDPEIIDSSGRNKYIWRYTYNPPDKIERNISINRQDAPFIQVLPVNFKYGVEGSYENWKTFGDWIFNLNKGRYELTDSEKQKINSLLAGVDKDIEKAKILYKYLQDYTRYVNVNIDIGGMQTYPASYVCTNKYGDCKALSNYMQAMLKYAGIKSYYTLIRAGRRILDIDTNFPEQKFNHAILTLPIDKDTVFLECTSKNTPFGYISSSIQGRKALLIDERNSRFVDIPTKQLNDVKCTRHIEVDIDNQNVDLLIENRGSEYEYLTYLLKEKNRNVLEKYIRENILHGSYELLDYSIEKDESKVPNIELKASCKVNNLYKKYGNNLVLKIFPINTPKYELPENRTQDVKIELPEYYSDTIVYDIANFDIAKVPNDINIESKYGRYEMTIKSDENKVIVSKSVIIYQGEYSISEYQDFFNFILSVWNNERTNLYIEIL